MVRSTLAAVLFLAVALPTVLPLGVPPAVAHGGSEFGHVNPLKVMIEPGQPRPLELTFTEGMGDGKFEAGWVFVLVARLCPSLDPCGSSAPVDSPPMTVELHPGHIVQLGPKVAEWTVTSNATQVFTGAIPQTSTYSLVFNNTGPRNSTIQFFYDQSCNCAGKPLPVEVPRGMVVFNVDVKKGTTWQATFPEPPVHTLAVTLAKRTHDRSQWPGDFQVLAESPTATVRNVGAGPVRLHEINWTADQDGRYYFFVQSTSIDTRKFNTTSAEAAVGSVMVTPLYEQIASSAKPTPWPVELLLPAAAVAALALARARRR